MRVSPDCKGKPPSIEKLLNEKGHYPWLRTALSRICSRTYGFPMTASLPLPFNGPSGASKAAMEVFAAVYRAELKPFDVEVVIAAAGNMKTGGPAKTASALKRVADNMNSEQRDLYGEAFETFARHSTRCRAAGWSQNQLQSA